VTRIVIQEFTPPTETIASIPGSGTELPATYVHHCHILEHEDDDLMRPWTIVGDDDHGHATSDDDHGHGHGTHDGGHGHGH
jgi:spore coat protein A